MTTTDPRERLPGYKIDILFFEIKTTYGHHGYLTPKNEFFSYVGGKTYELNGVLFWTTLPAGNWGRNENENN